MSEGEKTVSYFDNYKRQLNLLIDNNRTLKYKYAIHKAVQPGDVVIDFGCGTGVLGFFALQAGATHVYAIEETSIIDYAQKVALKNGLADKITFIKKPGRQVTAEDIPEKVNIILSEPVSNLLLEGEAWSTIEYLKKFLEKDGIILPQAGSLSVVPVNTAPPVFQDAELLIGSPNVYNIDFLGLSRMVFYKSNIANTEWLAEPQFLLKINLLKDKLSDRFHNTIKFSFQNAGQLYGLEFSFKIRVFENIYLSSAESRNYNSWTPLFAPAARQNLVCKGDILRVTIYNELLQPYKTVWTINFEHQSQLLPVNDGWWDTGNAKPRLAPGVLINDKGLLCLKKDNYYQYDFDNELEQDFIQLISKGFSFTEMVQIIEHSQNYNLSFQELRSYLIEFVHKLLLNTLIELPIPPERFQSHKFQSVIHLP
ncbi:MAG: 50S ribosomal protein L11 methyltransferase [Candidatus Helarchaeota archaeon]